MLRALLAATALFVAAGQAQAQVNAADLKWGSAGAALPPGAQAAVLSGDPGKAGTFVMRMRLPAGYRIPAHNHPSDEYVTVLSGDLSLGMGDVLDTTKAARLEAGGFAVAHTGMNHFAFTTGGAEIQVSAEGPFAITYVNPADDPRKH